MGKRENESGQLKELISKMLKENHLQGGMDQITVKDAWQQVMGPGVANYTEEVKLKNGELLIKLSSSALRQELDYGKDKILRLMNDYLPDIRITSVRLR